MVEVFKTNIDDTNESKMIIRKLNDLFPDIKVNFDLDDCDKILRIEGVNIDPKQITNLLNSFSYQCEVLI